MGNMDGASTQLWMMLVEQCLKNDGWYFLWDPEDEEPWFNWPAIHGFTGVVLKTAQNKGVKPHNKWDGYYRLSHVSRPPDVDSPAKSPGKKRPARKKSVSKKGRRD